MRNKNGKKNWMLLLLLFTVLGYMTSDKRHRNLQLALYKHQADSLLFKSRHELNFLLFIIFCVGKFDLDSKATINEKKKKVRKYKIGHTER